MSKCRALWIAAAMLLTGCGCEVRPNIGDYVCSSDEHARVEHETNYCAENTGFTAHYCYQSTIQRVCRHKSEPPSAVATREVPND